MVGGEISWMSKKKEVVALSIIKSKYMETTHGRK
jgi:hypothetical protein